YETKYDVGVGTATVTTGTGAVVITDPGMGNNSVVYGATNYRTFAAHIIGMGVSFDAGVTWYKISAMADSDSFTVTDWNDSTYTGGTKTGVEVVIEALYPIVVTSTNIYAKILDLATKLDKDKIPQDNRFLVIPPDVGNLLKQSSQLVVAVQESYKDVVQNGLLGSVAGFKIYVSNQVLGDGTNGWHCLAGHKAGITFAHAMTESRILDSEDNFAKKYQGLNVYGAKVLVERRKALAELFCVITGTGDDWLKPTSGRV
ncbi:MAG: hypothetical protein KKB31_08065, partial [Nanoarchaeota archaeon]|nr:hypothetical protein [Nanoarchaeota archaeon]